jgi:hypothetical protein
LALQLDINITGQVLETVLRKGGQLLAGLVTLGVVIISDSQERN